MQPLWSPYRRCNLRESLSTMQLPMSHSRRSILRGVTLDSAASGESLLTIQYTESPSTVQPPDSFSRRCSLRGVLSTVQPPAILLCGAASESHSLPGNSSRRRSLQEFLSTVQPPGSSSVQSLSTVQPPGVHLDGATSGESVSTV